MAIYLSNRDGNGKTNEEGHYRLQTRIFEGFNLFQDDLKVVEESPLSMAVEVSVGDYRLETAAGYSYTGWIDTPTTVSIDTADPANPRITSIVLYVDKGAATSASPPNNPGITKLMAVNGTPAGSPSAPSGSAIQSAVGAGNPYYVLATVLVGAAVTQITNSNITDLRVKMKLEDGLVGTNALQDLSVTQAKLANAQIIDTARLVDLAVTNAKVANNSLNFGKMDYSTTIYGRIYFNGAAAASGGTVFGAGSTGVVPFETLHADTKGGVTKPSNGLLVVPTSGVYLIWGDLGQTDVPTAVNLVSLAANPAGTAPATTQRITSWNNMSSQSVNNRGATVSAIKYLTAGTAVALLGHNGNSGAVRWNYTESKDEVGLSVVRIA